MKECSKSIIRRLSNPNFVRKYFSGNGIDIGGKPDPLILYKELFPLMGDVRTWDIEDGDAQQLNGLENESFDFVHSSHCLEHLHDPEEGIKNWFRILRAGGHLVITVPDEDLYEQSVFPSTFNHDHKWCFTIFKHNSWSEKSINIFDLLIKLGKEAQIIKIELLDSTYRYNFPRYDQTLTPIGESGVEIIVRKLTPQEIESGGVLEQADQPEKELRVHLNQYKDDLNILKTANSKQPPFTNDSDI